jgi:ACS family D-galactonate transporter-like MFS transporter
MPDFASRARGSPKPLGIAILLGVGVVVNYFDRINLSVSRDALHSEFGLTTVGFGYLSSAFNWTYAILQLPMGVVLDRFGVKRLGMFSAIIWSIASFGSAAATGVGSFFVSRLLLGVGEAPTFPANAKAVGAWFPRERRGLPTAIFDAAAKFGPAIGVLAVGWLVLSFGWRWCFAATGFLSLLYFAAFWRFYRDPQIDHSLFPEHSQSATLGYLLKRKKIIGLTVGFFGYNYCFYLLLYWMPSYFSSMKVGAAHSLLYTSVPWLFATATDLSVGGWLVDALIAGGYSATRVRQTILILGTALGLALAGAMQTTNPVTAVVWLSIALGGLSAAAPVGWSIPALISPRNSVGKVAGILNFGNQLAGIASPIATAHLVGAGNSYGRAFGVAAALLLLGIASYLLLLGKIEPVAEPSDLP